ncbi:MAG: anaerobic ribonucleoside triphosphate reductase [Clostridia bacterium]|nr:anaerobic ribonucleoside triphosphate reductase [Clostridia bacterium]
MIVKKRDGRRVKFDKEKVKVAVLKAFLDVDGEETAYAKDKAREIANHVESLDKDFSVEEVQDLVEEKLMASNRKDVARSYILYRYERNKLRKSKTYAVFNSIVNAESNDVTKENANMNAETPAGMMMKFASETTKAYTDDELISEEAREAIDNNYIHTHDKDYYPTKSLTCLQHPLDRILNNGFRAGHGSSRPAKRIETASIIGCISMETVQNEMHGGQAIPAFDYYLAPYVRSTYVEEVKKLIEFTGVDYTYLFDEEIEDYIKKPLETLTGRDRVKQQAINKTVSRVHQSMEAFIHNMNTIHSRGGNQVVFSSINYGTDTSAEGRCIIREILNSTYNGVGNGETPIFPIQIWKLKKGYSAEKGDRNYDLLELACKVTARRFFPNFINLDTSFNVNDLWRENDPERYKYECATMGCRTRVFENRHGEKSSVGRGNLSFTTINIVRLALECMNIESYEEKISTFYEKLDKYTDVAVRQLYDRYCFQRTALKSQFPLLMAGLWNGSENLQKNDRVGDLLKQGTLGVGFIGLAECLIALTGKHHGESEESQKLGIEIITHLRDRVKMWADKYDLNYSVLATPAEGLSGKFTKKDRRDFGVIEYITDKDYYTNSNHVPVWYHCTIKHKAEVEAPYHALTLGGHIFYVELDGDATHNPEAVMQVVTIIRDNDIGYGSINHLRNRCLDCGWESAIRDLKKCLECGGTNIDTIERITGYLVGTVNSWNAAKLAELNDRVCHE